ncbi:MAG: hypothetical protein SF002_03920 [Alphaproteobacteria bacterium]|nr:hypothetical protein [Alphaproteobacteria bacterium]
MNTDRPVFFWDSCVFFRYLNRDTADHPDYLEHIARFVSDLDQKRIGVFCSGMALAEITPTAIVTSGRTIKDFYDTFMAHFTVIHTNNEIMKSVAQVKGRSYIHKDPQENQKSVIYQRLMPSIW